MAFNNFILVCSGNDCSSKDGDAIFKNLIKEAEIKGVKSDVQVVKAGCFSFCEKGPVVKILPDETFYINVKPEDAEEIISQHIIKGQKVERLLYDLSDREKYAQADDSDSYHKQLRIVLRNCGVINPKI